LPSAFRYVATRTLILIRPSRASVAADAMRQARRRGADKGADSLSKDVTPNVMDCAPHLVIAEVLPFRTGLVAHHASEHAAGWRREVERIVVDRMFGEERLVRFECCTDARFITEGKCAVVAGADPFVRVLADEGDEFLVIASQGSALGGLLKNPPINTRHVRVQEGRGVTTCRAGHPSPGP
jgi:hypothetical protein